MMLHTQYTTFIYLHNILVYRKSHISLLMVLVRKRKRKAAIASLIMKIRWRESFNLEWILCSFFLSFSFQAIHKERTPKNILLNFYYFSAFLFRTHKKRKIFILNSAIASLYIKKEKETFLFFLFIFSVLQKSRRSFGQSPPS